MVKKESVTHKTPNGGVASEAYYFDDDMNTVDEEKATKVIIRYLDGNGNLIFETFGTIDR